MEIKHRPLLTYDLDFNKGQCLVTEVTGKQALNQLCYQLLMTERYKYEIYDNQYSTNFDDLIGMPMTFVKSEAKRRINEVLLTDSRILKTDKFVFEEIDNKLVIRFNVTSIYAKIDFSMELNERGVNIYEYN